MTTDQQISREIAAELGDNKAINCLTASQDFEVRSMMVMAREDGVSVDNLAQHIFKRIETKKRWARDMRSVPNAIFSSIVAIVNEQKAAGCYV